MIRELDMIVLTHDLSDNTLQRGDIGTVVHVYREGAAFEVEFVNGRGETIAVLTLAPEAVRPIGGRDILHVRELLPA
ncbi:MAG: DUF4926 domain-containing protein [Anaerolineales bacterium]